MKHWHKGRRRRKLKERQLLTQQQQRYPKEQHRQRGRRQRKLKERQLLTQQQQQHPKELRQQQRKSQRRMILKHRWRLGKKLQQLVMRQRHQSPHLLQPQPLHRRPMSYQSKRNYPQRLLLRLDQLSIEDPWEG